jgi:hypothetical protein
MLDGADLNSVHGGYSTFGTGVPLTVDNRQLSVPSSTGIHIRDFT